MKIYYLGLCGAIGLLLPTTTALGARQLHDQSPPVARGGTAADSYVLAGQDVLAITVWNHPDLTGKYTVQPDGSIRMPLLGSIVAAGGTIRDFETRLMRALKDGFVLEPRIVVALEQTRGSKVFIFGNVGSPGMYALVEGQRLLELLARAGYGAAAEAVIVRPKNPTGATLPEQAGDGEVIRVNLRELEHSVEKGSLSQNLALKDGDTIFIPRLDPTRVFVSGHVRSPGAYSITEGTTVLQALTLAGGVTEQAAVNRLRIMRLVKGKQKTVKARLSDVLRPGDTLIVPERFF